MREIKFRGKAIDTGEWVYGVPIPNGFGKRVFMINLTLGDKVAYPMERLHEYCQEVIPETVSQYTGAKDRNGLEIFGDSAVRYDVYSGDVYRIGRVSNVTWNEFCWKVDGLRFVQINNIEVIGNKFDNPELLEG